MVERNDEFIASINSKFNDWKNVTDEEKKQIYKTISTGLFNMEPSQLRQSLGGVV